MVFMEVVMNLNIPDHEGLVHYYEVLEPLAYRLLGAPLPESENMVRRPQTIKLSFVQRSMIFLKCAMFLFI